MIWQAAQTGADLKFLLNFCWHCASDRLFTINSCTCTQILASCGLHVFCVWTVFVHVKCLEICRYYCICDVYAFMHVQNRSRFPLLALLWMFFFFGIELVSHVLLSIQLHSPFTNWTSSSTIRAAVQVSAFHSQPFDKGNGANLVPRTHRCSLRRSVFDTKYKWSFELWKEGSASARKPPA